MNEQVLADEVKSKVLRSFSHELKSPLNGVTCTVDIICASLEKLRGKKEDFK
jgi:K+-sensing histidine kinase KdpD